MLIEGVAFPVDVLNANNQGIPLSEVPNTLASLPLSPIRICTRLPNESAHHCDFSGDPKSEIGRIIEAWHDTTVTPSVIMTVAEILDSVAIQKIMDGVWANTWSFFGSGIEDEKGFIHDFHVEAMTLVNDPAWKESQFKVIAASAGDNPTIKKWRFDARMTVKASDSKEKKVKKMTDKPEDVFDKVALESRISTMIADHQKAMASKDALIVEKDTEIASLKSASATMLTQEAATKLAESVAASKIAEFQKLQTADKERAVAMAEHVKVAVAAGLVETEEKARLEKFSAAEIKTQTEMIKKIAASTGNGLPNYAADPAMASLEGEFGLTVGDFSSGTWKRGANI